MTIAMIESDTRGIDALSGETDDNVALPALIWEGVLAELGQLPEAPHIDPFDDEPWRLLPTVEQLEHLWASSPKLETLIYQTARRAAPALGGSIASYMEQQWWLSEMELELIKGREAQCDEAAGTDDVGAAGGVAAVASADASGGGVDFSGGPEDGDAVGAGGEVAVAADAGQASPVQGKRRPRKARS